MQYIVYYTMYRYISRLINIRNNFCNFQDSGVMPYLHMLGFEVIGYGCSTCVANASTQPLIPPNSLVCCGVLSGNRNFEGRLVPGIHANYLASPPLVIAYGIGEQKIIMFFSKKLLSHGLWSITLILFYSW